MAFNLASVGADLGAFLDAIKGPLPEFILAMGVAIAIVGLIIAVIYVIKTSVGRMGHIK